MPLGFKHAADELKKKFFPLKKYLFNEEIESHKKPALKRRPLTYFAENYSQQAMTTWSQQSPFSQQGAAAIAAVETSMRVRIERSFFMGVLS